MYKVILSIFICCCITQVAIAQDKWDLKKCVDYALANNISIKQTEVQTSIAALQVAQSKQNLYPTANFNAGPGFNNGRNQDPTTFSLITQSFVSASMQLQTSAQIFNWYSRKNTILANEWLLQANKASTDKLKNDIALLIANGYLQALLAKEQQNIAAVQVQQTQAQLSNTRKLVDAGSLPELNAAELEAQLARDSSSFITSQGNAELALLQLKANMNIDAATQFEIVVPPIEKIPVEAIADLQPESVYALAIVNLPQQRVNDFNLKAAQKNSQVAKAALYPTISAFGSLSSSFNSRATEITGIQFINAPIGKVNVSGVDYSVFPNQPFSTFSTAKTGFFKQSTDNFRQAVGLSISIPIFNGGFAKFNYGRSKLNIKSVELQQMADNLKIKQDIYQAYNAAVVALQKFNASKKSVETAQRSYDFAKKRNDVGMLSTFELITNQNNLFRAKLDYSINQFDYVFKMKVLEFYKGQGLKL